MNINEYLQKHKELKTITAKGHHYQMRELAPRVKCADGFEMSVQVSDTHYCHPRIDDALEYDAVEVGFPNQREDALMEWCDDTDNPTDTVYAYVPVSIVDAVIETHGGIVE